MAGKRLLDAAKLFNAGTSIAKQHFTLRRQQWDLYSKTSTLAKAVRSQTERVTVTAAAAFELAKRFNETGPSWQRGQNEAQQAHPAVNETIITRKDNQEPDVDDTAPGPVGGTTAQEVSSPETGVGHDDGTLSSLRRRELQRQLESQIPAVTADTQASDHHAAGGQDTFGVRSESSSPELSSLPRAKLPKHSEQAQGSDEHVPDRELNQDVYYAPTQGHESLRAGENGGGGQAGTVNTDVFASPRVSHMLGQGSGDIKNPYAGRQKLPPQPLPEMVAAKQRWEQQKQQDAVPAQAGPPPVAAESAPAHGDAEMQDLAASIAQETIVIHPRSQHRPLMR